MKSYLISPYFDRDGRFSLENLRIIMEEKEEYILIAERKAKQDFLKEEILEMNFDTELFLDFCEQKKSSDIDQ